MLKVVGAVAAIVAVAGIIVAVGMWRGLIPVPGLLLSAVVRGGEPERSARYYPPDTLAYFWATLTPGDGQLKNLLDIWERLDDSREFRDLVELARDEFEEETGIDFETGVIPWIGPEFSVGVLDADWRSEQWTVAGMVEVRDEGAADAFFRDWLDYMESEHYEDFHDDTYRGFDIVVSEDGAQAYALTDDWLVFSTSERGLEDLLARLEDDEEDSLASSEDFVEARSHLPERRFASTYFSLVEAHGLLEDVWDETFEIGGSGWTRSEGTNWVAASVGVAEAGIVMEVAAPVGIDHPLEVADLADPSGLLSDDTMGFVAATFDPDVDRWRGAMRRYEIGDFLGPDEIDGLTGIIEAMGNEYGSLATVRLDEDNSLDVLLDIGLSIAAVTTGIDLEDDLLDHMGGEIIVVVGDVDFDGSPERLEESAVDVTVMASYRDGRKDDLAGTIGDATERLGEFAGLERNTKDIGADDRAVLFDLGYLGGESLRYRPGYVFHRGYLTLGSTERALEGVVRRQNGDPDTLSANEGYQRALRLLPEQRQFLGYVDLHRILRQLEGEDVGLNRDQHRVLEQSIGTLAMSSYSPHCAEASEPFECEPPAGSDVSRYTVVLTLFPE